MSKRRRTDYVVNILGEHTDITDIWGFETKKELDDWLKINEKDLKYYEVIKRKWVEDDEAHPFSPEYSDFDEEVLFRKTMDWDAERHTDDSGKELSRGFTKLLIKKDEINKQMPPDVEMENDVTIRYDETGITSDDDEPRWSGVEYIIYKGSRRVPREVAQNVVDIFRNKYNLVYEIDSVSNFVLHYQGVSDVSRGQQFMEKFMEED